MNDHEAMVALVLLVMAMLVFVAMVFVIFVMFMIAAAVRGRLPGFAGYQVHATFGAATRLILHNFGMHGADILDPGVHYRGVEILRRVCKGTVSQCPL